MRATSYDPMIILNGSDRETAEVLEFFKDFVKDKEKEGFKFTKSNIKDVTSEIKDIGDGDKLTVTFDKKEWGEKYDWIDSYYFIKEKYDWDSKYGFEMEGYIAKHCDCETMEKVGDCDHEIGAD